MILLSFRDLSKGEGSPWSRVKIPLERKCHEKNLDRTHHDYHGYRDHHRFRHNRGSVCDDDRIPAWRKHVLRSARWGAERRLCYLRVLDERERERRERAAVKARRRQLAWKAIKPR